ncbi:MAG: tetraacyldisaccharide 4'-kinase [Bacteroidia bacterium]|nr:tetraacyldisaccharide 4'-kinase [Bacteroidia bacterium]
MLGLLSFFYGLIIELRNRAYDKRKLKIVCFPVKVISIGNLSVGGTGKTPMAAFIINALLKKGYKVAYLSRGYKRKTRGFQLFTHGKTKVESIGDEAYQIAMQFPHICVAVCEKRVEGVRRILACSPVDYIVLDDAFQHRQIGRNLDIVMIDATCSPLLDSLLPKGRLREPIKSLKRAQVVCINKCMNWEQGKYLKAALRTKGYLLDNTLVFLCYYRIKDTLNSLSPILNSLSVSEALRYEAFVISALANNIAFSQFLENNGIRVVHTMFYEDHHFYTILDIQKIIVIYKKLKALKKEIIILTTEKDATKLRPFFIQNSDFQDLPIFVVGIELAFYENLNVFEQVLDL